VRKLLNKQQIDAIFETSNHQSEVCDALYRLAFPGWDELQAVEGWPGIGKEAGFYILRKFMKFDRKHHPNVLPGGLWMNKGFSTHEGAGMGLGPWELCTDNCVTSPKETQP
jgi:hypothetical protein